MPAKLLALPLAVALVWLLPHRDIATNIDLWYLAPAWIALGHVLTASSYVVTARRLRPAWYLLVGSAKVYSTFASGAHLATAFLIALAEETVFRFALLPPLANYLTGAGAVAFTSLLFSLLHLKRGRRATSIPFHVDLFLFAVVLGTVTLLTRSLLPAVLLHTTRNYILRCMLVSKAEYNTLSAAERRAHQDHE